MPSSCLAFKLPYEMDDLYLDFTWDRPSGMGFCLGFIYGMFCLYFMLRFCPDFTWEEEGGGGALKSQPGGAEVVPFCLGFTSAS